MIRDSICSFNFHESFQITCPFSHFYKVKSDSLLFFITSVSLHILLCLRNILSPIPKWYYLSGGIQAVCTSSVEPVTNFFWVQRTVWCVAETPPPLLSYSNFASLVSPSVFYKRFLDHLETFTKYQMIVNIYPLISLCWRCPK